MVGAANSPLRNQLILSGDNDPGAKSPHAAIFDSPCRVSLSNSPIEASPLGDTLSQVG